MAVQQWGIFSDSADEQEDVNRFIWFYIAALYNPSEIVDWNYSLYDPVDASVVLPFATIFNTNYWNTLRGFITSRKLDYFHYFGHGSQKSIGGGITNHSTITLDQLRKSPTLKTNGLTFVALDGCNTLDGTDLIKAFTGYDRTVSRFTLASQGNDPHLGCGWNKTKSVAWVLQQTVNNKHFWFWEDFYFFLTRRDLSGFMFTQYKEAYRPAKDPMGNGRSHTLDTNSEASGFKMVGCDDCRFDERPGIVQ